VARDQKKARREHATIVFADECGVLMSPNVRRSWAPKGKTPILEQKTRSRTKISIMGAIATTPSFRKVSFIFRLLAGKNFGARECLAFLKQLLANLRGKVILIWDRLLAHRAVIITRFLKKQRRLTIELLPPYAPDLNPVESVWSHLKMNKMANFCPKDQGELKIKAKASVCSIRNEKDILKNLLKHVPLNFGL